MTCFSYLFEAKSIQDYILRSGRLRHIVGASELIDALGRELLDQTLLALSLNDEQVRFSRRAGGAVFAFTDSQDVRDALRKAWTLTVQQFAPGLPFVSAAGEGENDYTAYLDARQKLEVARNWQVTAALPAGSPVTRYAPRTGLPAVTHNNKFGDLDEATARFGRDEFWKSGGLAGRFVQGSQPEHWPHDLNYRDDGATVFPFVGENRYLGLLHADGNGLGQLLKKLSNHVATHPDRFVKVFRAFSDAVEAATRAAAEYASAQVLEPARKEKQTADADDPTIGVYPARPIVLGGDDLTILIRADLAIPFATDFLRAFEKESRTQMDALRKEFKEINDLPEALTAGAGIAFVKSNHPFYMTHELTEGLAKWAKDRAKEHKQTLDHWERVPPTLAFYRVSTASHGHYDDVRREELTFGSENQQIVTSLGAYCIDHPDAQTSGLPALKDLRDLAQLFGSEKVARGPTRQLLTLIGQDLDEARRRYERWKEVMKKREPKTIDAIMQGLERLCGTLDESLPVSQRHSEQEPRVTPLADLQTLLSTDITSGDTADTPNHDSRQEAA